MENKEHNENNEQNDFMVYLETAEYARQNDELEAYRASHRAMLACKKLIEKSISDNFDGMHLKPECVDVAVKEFSPERVEVLLIITLQKKDYDGRFSRSNKEWAEEYIIPDDMNGYDRKAEWVIDSHPAVLDGYIKLFRNKYLFQS